MKRSVNFTPRHPKISGGDIYNLCNWLGMSEAEQRVVFGRAPLFVNLNGEETVPAKIVGGKLHCNGRIYQYKSTDIHPVTDDGLTWYEINDTALITE